MIIIIIVCGFVMLLPYGCMCCLFSLAAKSAREVSTNPSSVVFDLENLWNINLPDDANPVYVYYARGGFHGDGFFYSVFECEQTDDFFKDFSVEYNEQIKQFFESGKYDNTDYYNIDFDNAYLPDFTCAHISVSYHLGSSDKIYIGERSTDEYCDDHLYMCYFYQTNLLYIYEEIT